MKLNPFAVPAITVLAVTFWLWQPATAQAPLDLQLFVAADTDTRSPLFELTPASDLMVRLEAMPTATDGVVRIYVFDEDGVLRGLDDPESAASIFTWSPAAAGRYFVKVRNATTSAVTVRLQSVRTRGKAPQPARNGATVRVAFATNRTIVQDPGVRFGADPAAGMSYGYCDVSMPRDHRLGELEAPSIWRLELRDDPDKHVTVVATETQPDSVFFNQLGGRIAQSARKEALVFVHGFNASFIEAARRTAQIAYDLRFDGPPIAFSWPSQGLPGPLDYTKDQRNADLSAQALEQFLLRLKGTSPQLTVHLIAHSMGNRVLGLALQQMAAELPRRKPPLQEVAMMAPDLDAELFRQISGKIAASAVRVTLYASSQDLALKAAQGVAGYPRAGEGGDRIVVVNGIDTVDASSVETSVLGLQHAYYADNSTILSDLHALIRGVRADDRFGLRPMKTAAGGYWRFLPSVR